jgi:uncharacterized protein (TIGR02217 family)
MGFHDVRLPTDFAYGYRGGPGFATVIHETASGHEERITRRAGARHRFRADKELLSGVEVGVLRDFALARRGSLFGFRHKDWNDYTSNADGVTAPTNLDQLLGSGDGTKVNFQLRKSYDLSGLNPYVRTITLPVAATVLVAVDGTPAGHTVNLTTGIVTMDVAPTGGALVTAGYQFDVPVRFDSTIDELLDVEMTAFNVARIQDVALVEILDETMMPETWDPGGSLVLNPFEQSISISAQVRFLHLTATVTGLSVYLPIPTHLPGGDYFVFLSDAASSQTFTIRDDAGASVGTVAPGATKRVLLSRNDVAQTATWVAL